MIPFSPRLPPPSESSSPVWFLTLLYPSALLAKRPGWNERRACCCLFINASENRKASDVGCILSGDRLWTMRSCVKRHKLACKSVTLEIKLPFIFYLSPGVSVVRLISQTAGPHFFYASTEKTRHSLGRRQSVTFISHSYGHLNCARKKAWRQMWRVFPAKFNSSIRTTWVEHLYPNLFTEHSANKCINYFFLEVGKTF